MFCVKHLKWITILTVLQILVPLSMCNVSNGISKQKYTIESFYRIIIAEKFFEIPDSSQIDRLKPYISLQLQKLLFDARNAEDIIAGKETEPVPPVVEGSLFTSLFEGPDSFTDVNTDPSAENTFLVGLEYKNRSGTPGADTTFKWNDRVCLVKENGIWVIDDLELLGNWDFARKTRVRSILNSVVDMK